LAHDVFVSYASDDKIVADAACATLEAAGIRCWIAPRDLHAGDDYAEAIVGAIKASEIFLLVFSAIAQDSRDVRNELHIAATNERVILSLRTQDIKPQGAFEYHAARLHWLDALTPPLENALGRLVDQSQTILRALGAKKRERRGSRRLVKKKGGLDTAVGLEPATQAIPDTEIPAAKLSCDVYISHSRVDNDRMLGQERGWVDVLYDAVHSRLSQLIGQEVRIFYDGGVSIQAGTSFGPRVSEAIQDARVFLVLVSPSYLRSEWCRRELELFVHAAERSGGLLVGTRSRIVKVNRFPVPHEQLPKELQQTVGYDFYRVKEDGCPIELNVDFDRGSFLALVNGLCYDLTKLIGA
jgi:hypothetical protein